MPETKDIHWNDGFLMGAMLLTREITVDSFGDPISGMNLYRLGTHVATGKYIVVPKGISIEDGFHLN